MNNSIDITVVVPAAGQGQRMGASVNKLLLPLAGKPMLAQTLNRLCQIPWVQGVVLVAAERDFSAFDDLINDLPQKNKILPLVTGGQTRSESVRNGLEKVKGLTPWVMVHDGARPLVCASLIERLIKGAVKDSIVIPAIAVQDTLRRCQSNKTFLVDRNGLYQVQTPQLFSSSMIDQVFFNPDSMEQELSDEASFFERIGLPVVMVEGDKTNLKITTPEDVLMAEHLLQTQG